MRTRYETNLDLIRATLELWRMSGVQDARAYLRGAAKLIAAEQAWYDHLKQPNDDSSPPWRVALALWLLDRERRHSWRRAWFTLRSRSNSHPIR